MENKKKIYGIKLFDEVELIDYWDLDSYPLYVYLNKKQTPYIYFYDYPITGYEKVDSLKKLIDYIRKFDWTIEKKYNERILHTLQNKLFVHHSV